jgi:hypothetical protein
MMPSEITLTENTRVRCRSKVVRVLPVQQKFGVAARLEGYEYLPKAETVAQVSASFPRISNLPEPAHGVQNASLPGSEVAVSGAVSQSVGTDRLGNS